MLCDYGCGQEGKYLNKRLNKWCCSDKWQSCPEIRRKNILRQSVPFSDGQLNRLRNNYNHIFEEDGSKLDLNNIRKHRRIKVKCINCGYERSSTLHDYFSSKTELCKSCVNLGDRNVSRRPDVRKKLKIWAKERDHPYVTPEWIQMQREMNSGKNSPRYGEKHTEETKKLMSESHKRKFLDSEFCKEFGRRFVCKPTKPELELDNLLKSINLKYKYVGDHSCWIGGKNPDFINKENKKIIELFGEWWHGAKRTGKSKIESEKEIKDHYNKYGYNCLVIWEFDLSDSEFLKNKLKKFTEENIL